MSNKSTPRKSYTPTKIGGAAFPLVETNISDREGVRKVFLR